MARQISQEKAIEMLAKMRYVVLRIAAAVTSIPNLLSFFFDRRTGGPFCYALLGRYTTNLFQTSPP